MALHEVVRVLRPQGRLLIVDFVTPDVDTARVCHTYVHFGFLGSQMEKWIKNVGLILEQKLYLTPIKNENNERQMVAVWLARDPRILIDDINDKEVDFA
ncbi:hypothetical protein GCM10023260_06940 [Bartonella acomydis]|uniref:Uncharacterized protein n=1 Tax=Bartonella acomydis TaxID=686234 RepID=A0ABP9MJA3_9HYPH